MVMWIKQCHKPSMTGNGKDTTYKNGDDWGMVSYCLPTLMGFNQQKLCFAGHSKMMEQTCDFSHVGNPRT